MKSCQREPRKLRTRSSRSGSTSRSPRAVVSTIGKKQMANAIMMLGPMPYLNQTMISGPSATLGIMLRLTGRGAEAALGSHVEAAPEPHRGHFEPARPGEHERKRNADHHRQHIAAEDLD